MNFFQRLISFFRKPKPVQPAAVVLAPQAPAQPAPAPTPMPAPIPAPAPVYAARGVLPPGAYESGEPGMYRIDRGSFYGPIDLAWAHYRALQERDANLAAADAQGSAARATLQPGEIDVRGLDTDSIVFVCAFPHVFVGKVGPWQVVTEAINFIQQQGGSPPNLAFATVAPMSHRLFQGNPALYQGPLRAIFDQYAAEKGRP